MTLLGIVDEGVGASRDLDPERIAGGGDRRFRERERAAVDVDAEDAIAGRGQRFDDRRRRSGLHIEAVQSVLLCRHTPEHGARSGLERNPEDGVVVHVQIGQRETGAVDRDDTVRAIPYLDSRQRHAAGAGNGHGVVSPAVDDGRTHSLQRQAVRPDHDRTVAGAREGDDHVAIENAVNGMGEGPPAAIKDRVRRGGRRRGGEET